MSTRFAISLLLVPAVYAGAPPLDEMLSRLADNQEKAVAARNSIVYRQDTWVRILRSSGKISREEKRQYTVMPTEDSTDKKLEKFEGRYERGGKIYTYDAPKFQYKDTDIDGDLIEDMTEDMINDRKSRDGFSHDLFPMTRAEQRHYQFKYLGMTKVGKADAYRISFEPLKGDDDFGDDDRVWKGEILLDPEEFQPVKVTTELAFKIPVAVKILLGTNIKQLGFNVSYKKVADGLWFPSSYGTEFGITVLFGYKRTISMSVANTDFRRATAESTIQYETPKEQQ